MKNFKSVKMLKDKNARSKRKMISILLLLVLIVSVVTFAAFLNNSSQQTKQIDSTQNLGTVVDNDEQDSSQNATAARARNAIAAVDNDEIKFTSDGTPFLINPNRLRGGGPPKDGMPSIDDPKFISVEDADKWLSDDEFGLAIIHKGVKRFYSFQVLVWHEIVNDVIAGDPLLVTYCPLCGSGIVFERTIDGEEVEFGTSGKLFNSNLVMYDRKTDTYWTQIGGRAIIGTLTGKELKQFPADVTTWGEWKKVHPDSEVLSRDTGSRRQYGTEPYGNYYESRRLISPVEDSDDSLHPKAVVFGIKVNGSFKAYTEFDVKAAKVIEDTVNGVNIKIERDDAGIVTFTNLETNERIPHDREFWFAWFAFHTETKLYTLLE